MANVPSSERVVLRIFGALGLLLSWCLAGTATAAPITFTHSGTAGGTIGGIPFAASRFTFVGQADTDDVVDLDAVSSVDHVWATVSIEGVGDFALLTPTRTFVARAVGPVSAGIVGFSRGGAGGLDLFNGPRDLAFAEWDLTSGIGPVEGEARLIQWVVGEPILTEAGRLIFDEGPVAGRFRASVPEPAALTAAALLLALARRSRL